MRRLLSLVLVIVMLLSLCGCGKTDAAIAAEEAIAAIGVVTLDSEEAIAYAEKLYGILTDNEKESIENRLELANAREEYERLVQEAIEAEQAAIEAARIAKIETAMPEMDAFIKAANSIVWNLEFVAKYAGNVNGNGSRKFADSFMDDLESAYKDIDVALIAEGFPELAERIGVIMANLEMVIDLLNEMGRTNSTSNVTTMKTLSIETVQLIDALQVEYQKALEDAGLDG